MHDHYEAILNAVAIAYGIGILMGFRMLAAMEKRGKQAAEAELADEIFSKVMQRRMMTDVGLMMAAAFGVLLLLLVATAYFVVRS